MYMKLWHIRMWPVFATAFGFGIGTYSVSVLELTLYYSFEPFDVNKQTKTIPGYLRKILHFFVFTCLFVCLAAWVAYGTLVLTWMILGAVLEPEYYVPYAMASGSITLFAGAKGSQLYNQFQTTKKTVVRAINTHLAKNAHKRMCLLRNDDGSDINTNNSSIAETKALRLVDSDSTLSEILARCSAIDLMMALGLAKGSITDIANASEKFGMNREIFSALIAAARRDHFATLHALKKLGDNGTLGVAKEKLRVFYRLSEKQNESSLRLALKEAVICSQTVSAKAHEIESVVAVGRGAVGRLVDVLKEIDIEKGGQHKELHVLSTLLELIRNDGMEFQKRIFTKDWNALAAVIGLAPEIALGIGQLYMQQVRSDAATVLLDSLQCNTVLARVVMAVAGKSADNLRLYGPGSKQFANVLQEIFGIEIPVRDLAAFVAVSMSSLLNVSTLAEIWGLHDDVANSVSHLMGDSEGMGDIQIGLEPKPNAGHLQWQANQFNVSPPVFLGLVCIASRRVNENDSKTYVEEAIAWFVAKNPTDLNPDDLKKLVYNLCVLWSSTDRESVVSAVTVLLEVENSKFTRFFPIVLLSRGFLDPVAFFETYGGVFGLKTRHLNALCAQQWHFTNSSGSSEAFTCHTWRDCDRFRAQTMKRIAKFVTEKLITVKSVNRSKLRVVRGLLLMEVSFPKIFETILASRGLSSEMTRNLASFAMMACEHMCNPSERSKIFSTLGRLLNVTPEAVKHGIMNMCHDNEGELHASWDQTCSQSVLERMKLSAGLRRGASLIHMAESFEINSESLANLQHFVSDFDLISAQCRSTKQAVFWLADQLHQPRFLMYCISRDFEPGFGASAVGPIDADFHREIKSFLLQMNVSNASMLNGIDGICLQHPQKLAAFAPFLGVSDSNHIVMGCQLFGSVDLSTMVTNLEKFVDVLKQKAGKLYKPTKNAKRQNYM